MFLLRDTLEKAWETPKKNLPNCMCQKMSRVTSDSVDDYANREIKSQVFDEEILGGNT